MKHIIVAMAAVLFAALATAMPANVVTARGIGSVAFGMTVSQFSRSVGEALSPPPDPADQACFYLEAKIFPGVAFMFEDGRLRRIDVRTNTIRTTAGVTLGTSSSEVKLRYKSRITDEPHHYSGPEDRYLTAPLNAAVAVRFETSGSKVDSFYVGYKAQVQYVEGCL